MTLSQTSYFRPAQLKILNRNGIRSVNELLLYIPRRYIDRSQILTLDKDRVGDTVTFIGQVQSREVKYGRRRRLLLKCRYTNYTIEIVFFQGIQYYQKIFYPGLLAAFSGKLDTFAGKLTMMHPEFEMITEEETTVHTGKIVPLYKITEGMRSAYLTTKTLRKAIHDILADHSDKIQDYLNDTILTKTNLLSIRDALKKIHFPDKMEDVEQAKKRLAFDEILLFAILMKQKQKERKKIKKMYVIRKKSPQKSEEFIASLPFQLTKDQLNAIQTLQKLAQEESPFAALLQGDVGSGKTLVAVAAALDYIQEGFQAAIMAPTEILARQHYQNILNFFSIFPFTSVELLLGGEKASEKKAKMERIKRGDTLLIVGTHSLLQEKIEFSQLAFVVIDEQHRFGVEQREKLRSKSQTPDLLSMTATPIPRSLTLTLYGDLETILIKEKPKGRMDIETKLFSENDLDKLYKGVKKYVDKSQQAYIVYPLITESESVNWASLEAEYGYLAKNIFSGYKLGLLHSKLSAQEKDNTMQKFKRDEIQILVCTTVIEVGVDIPNATVMLIRNADKFGLSQLHQLRGRVGRGQKQSFCILVASQNYTVEADLRLQAMVDSNDGFYLAQKDLEIRGTGELMGLKQAGFSEFRIADLRHHYKLVEEANNLIYEFPEVMRNILAQKDWEKFLKKGMILFGN